MKRLQRGPCADEAAEPAPVGGRAHRVHGLGARGRGVRRAALPAVPAQVPGAQGHGRHAVRRAAGRRVRGASGSRRRYVPEEIFSSGLNDSNVVYGIITTPRSDDLDKPATALDAVKKP